MRLATPWWLITPFLLGSCLRAEPSAMSIPPDVDWLTTVTIFESGQVSGSRFEAPPSGGWAVSHRLGSQTFVLGFRDSDLQPLFELDPEAKQRFLDGTVRPTVGCEAGLPPAAWAVEIDANGRLDPEPVLADLPTITFAGLETLCSPLTPEGIDPLVVAPYSVERSVPCSVCEVDSFSPAGAACEYWFDLGRCGYAIGGRARARLGWDGSLCFEPGPCEAKGLDDDGQALFLCQSATPSVCDEEANRLSRPPLHEEDSFFISRQVRVFEDRRAEHTLSENFDEEDQFDSHLSSILELQGRILLTTHPKAEVGYHCDWPELADPSRPGKTELVFVDPETLETIETTTAPPCLTRTMRDPLGEGFIGAWEEATSDLRVGRFDARGRLLTQIPLGLPELEYNDPWVVGLHQLDPSGPIVVVVGAHEAHEDVELSAEDNHLIFLDPSLTVPPVDKDLSFIMPDSEKRTRLQASASIELSDPEGTGLAVIEGLTDGIYGMDDEGSPVFSARSSLPRINGSYRLVNLFSDRPDRLAASTGNSSREVFELLVDRGEVRVERRAIPFERDAVVTQLAPWVDGQLLIVAKTIPNSIDRSYITRFDPETWRFLPGARWLADSGEDDPGIASAHTLDSKGRVWVGFGTSGWLFRLEPRL